MPTVFICYRRSDAPGHAGRLFDALHSHFGDERVFMDIDTIEPGLDFVEVIERTIDRADVVLALIGPHWLESADGQGRRRLDNPDDYIRMELEYALRRGKPVIPVLTQGAMMPPADELPAGLRELASRNALELPDARWHHAVDRLVELLEQAGEPSVPDPVTRAHAFVSYASEDRAQVLAFVDRLRANAVPVWIDDGEIDAARQWSEVIVEAIEQCAAFVVLLSAAAAGSTNVVRELVLASEFAKPIVPLMLEPIEIPRSMRYQLAGIQHVNLYDRDDEANLQRVLRSLLRLGLASDRPAVAR